MIQIFEVIGLTIILVAIVAMIMVGIRDYTEGKNEMLEWCEEHEGFYTKDLIQGQQCLFPPKEDRR